MTRYHLLLGSALGAATVVLTGAGGGDGPAHAETAAPALAAENPEALKLLEQAAAAVAPERLAWLQMTLWQRIRWGDLNCEMTGTYLAAPGHRLRLEMQVKAGRAEGLVKLVSDGKALVRWQRYGDGKPSLTQTELPTLGEMFKTQAEVEWARGAFLDDQALWGAATLLRGVREKLRRAGQESVTRDGRALLRVTGEWPADARVLADLPRELRPEALPRQCCVYLDAKTLWPCRVEWWGSPQPQDPLALLMEVEFRDPVVNVPLPQDRCAREFALPTD